MTPSERLYIETTLSLILLTALRAAERKTTCSPETTRPDRRPRATPLRARTSSRTPKKG